MTQEEINGILKEFIDDKDTWNSIKFFFDIKFQDHVMDYRVNGTELIFDINQFRSNF